MLYLKYKSMKNKSVNKYNKNNIKTNAKNEQKVITLTENSAISFPVAEEINGDVLIIGNFTGVCGVFDKSKSGIVGGIGFRENSEIIWNNIGILNKTIAKKHRVYLMSSKITIDYFQDVIKRLCDDIYYPDVQNTRDGVAKKKGFINEIYKFVDTSKYSENVEKIFNNIKDMKFDTVIINPPYKGSLHLKFFEKALEHLNENGKMVIIEPAPMYINVRRNDTFKRSTSSEIKKYDKIKKIIKGHVESVRIENLNKDFNTENTVPFAITTIDMSKTFDKIKFNCCGDEKMVDSIYDCNLIGKYDLIWSILNKCLSYGDMMKNHITDKQVGGDYWYAKYQEIIKCNAGAFSQGTYKPDGSYIGDVFRYYYQPTYDEGCGLKNCIHKKKDNGNKETDEPANCVYGTKYEMENWEHFIMNNKLPMFINYVMSIDAHNNSKPFVPWLVDKKYTDDEINELFNFSNEEIELINSTFEKFKRNHTWFKRYMEGPNIEQ